MTPSQPAPVRSTASRARLLAVLALVLAAVAAAAWYAFLGWDHEYYEVDGIPQGPYRAWQVLGCGATIVVATVAAYVRARGVAAVLVLPAAAALGFAVPWSVDAAATDDTGMWAVGLVFLLVGAGTGLAFLLAVCSLVPARDRHQPAA